jgi:hypothetical protein
MLDIATNNRYKCTECKQKIEKGSKFFTDSKVGWRSSHTVNICGKCLAKMFLELHVSNKEVAIINKEVLADAVIKSYDEEE